VAHRLEAYATLGEIMKPNTWAMVCHLCGLIGYVGNGIGCIIAPLVVWLVKKDELPEVDRHGKEALNFNISIAIYGLILVAFTVCTFGLAIFLTGPLGLALVIFHVACVISAAINANNGVEYRYPFCIRLIK
jgi:hypothetical protein